MKCSAVAIFIRYVWNGCRRSDTPAFVKDKLKKQGRVVRETCFTEDRAGSNPRAGNMKKFQTKEIKTLRKIADKIEQEIKTLRKIQTNELH